MVNQLYARTGPLEDFLLYGMIILIGIYSNSMDFYHNFLLVAEVAGKLYKYHCMRYFSAGVVDCSKDRNRCNTAIQLLVELLDTFLLIL